MSDTFTADDEVAVALSVVVEYPMADCESVELLVAVHAAAQDAADRARARLIELGHFQ